MWEEKSVQIGHIRLNLAAGPENGSAILLLHGVARSWRDFSPVLPALEGRHTVLALDHRGHGRSDRANTYLVNDYVRDTIAFLRNYQAKPSVLWGHSLGAMVAAAAASQAPDRVSALILEDPPFHTMGDRMSQTLTTFFTGLRECALTPHASIAQTAAGMEEIHITAADGRMVRLGDVRDATQIRFGARCLMEMDPKALDPIVWGQWMDGYDMADALQGIRCPTLLLAGDYASGAMLAPEDASLIRQIVPDCIRVDFPHAGHLLHWQRTEELLRHVLAFLQAV